MNTAARPTARGGVLGSILLALLGGIVIGCLGTVLHANVVYLNDGKLWLPWGIIAALALTLSIGIFVGLTREKVAYTVLSGVVAFIIVAAQASGIPQSGLIVTNVSAHVPSAYLGWVWIVGLIVAVLAAQVITARILAKDAEQKRKSQLHW